MIQFPLLNRWPVPSSVRRGYVLPFALPPRRDPEGTGRGDESDSWPGYGLVSVTPDTVCAAKICVTVRGGVNVSVPDIVPPFTVPEKASVPL